MKHQHLNVILKAEWQINIPKRCCAGCGKPRLAMTRVYSHVPSGDGVCDRVIFLCKPCTVKDPDVTLFLLSQEKGVG